MVMKLKITLKVAQAVDNEGASFSEASLGRSDWEWKLLFTAGKQGFYAVLLLLYTVSI